MSQHNPKHNPKNNETAIDCRHISLHLGGKTILNEVSLAIKQGEITTLLGANGAGKSSLLKIMSGEISASNPQSSDIFYFNQPKGDWDRRVLAKHLGMLPQQSSLSFSFTVQEVVELGLLPLSLSRQQAKKAVEAALIKVDAVHLASQLYPLLSGGEKQRVHLARVLTQLSGAEERVILMLDEPTSALDLSHQHNTLRIAREMADKGAAVIIVLHDLNLAAQYSDRILLLNKGEIQADGTPWEVLTASHIQAVYQHKVTVLKHPHESYPVVYTR